MTKEQLKALREGKQMSQLEFGRWLGEKFEDKFFERTNTMISLWETGKHPIPSWMDKLLEEA